MGAYLWAERVCSEDNLSDPPSRYKPVPGWPLLKQEEVVWPDWNEVFSWEEEHKIHESELKESESVSKKKSKLKMKKNKNKNQKK